MMVRIVDDDGTKRTQCNRCGSILEYTPDDIQLVQLYENCPTIYDEYIICPYCKCKAFIGFTRKDEE
jgi:hypothetical protein